MGWLSREKGPLEVLLAINARLRNIQDAILIGLPEGASINDRDDKEIPLHVHTARIGIKPEVNEVVVQTGSGCGEEDFQEFSLRLCAFYDHSNGGGYGWKLVMPEDRKEVISMDYKEPYLIQRSGIALPTELYTADRRIFIFEDINFGVSEFVREEIGTGEFEKAYKKLFRQAFPRRRLF